MRPHLILFRLLGEVEVAVYMEDDACFFCGSKIEHACGLICHLFIRVLYTTQVLLGVGSFGGRQEVEPRHAMGHGSWPVVFGGIG